MASIDIQVNRVEKRIELADRGKEDRQTETRIKKYEGK